MNDNRVVEVNGGCGDGTIGGGTTRCAVDYDGDSGGDTIGDIVDGTTRRMATPIEGGCGGRSSRRLLLFVVILLGGVRVCQPITGKCVYTVQGGS